MAGPSDMDTRVRGYDSLICHTRLDRVSMGRWAATGIVNPFPQLQVAGEFALLIVKFLVRRVGLLLAAGMAALMLQLRLKRA